MPGPENIRDYLDAVTAQIRWKRARPAAARELEAHLEDQRNEFQEAGCSLEEAERLAVEEMGDPVSVGADLDRLHRPKPQWGLVALTLALLLFGGWLRYALTRAGSPWGEDLDPFRCALSAAAGATVLLGVYFLDVSRLLRWAKWVYIGAVALGMLCLCFLPRVNNASYFTRYVALLYPAVYALWLYDCRGKGWRGLLAAVGGGVPLAAVCMLALAAVGTLAMQSVFAVALNLGFVAFTAQLPLVTGNLHSVADCALIGLALAAFRSETLLRDGVPACQTLQKRLRERKPGRRALALFFGALTVS